MHSARGCFLQCGERFTASHTCPQLKLAVYFADSLRAPESRDGLPLRHLWSEAGWIDNSWSVPEGRSDKAGKLLAQTLAQRVQGHRPVTLIGFGLGARVIMVALQVCSTPDPHTSLNPNPNPNPNPQLQVCSTPDPHTSLNLTTRTLFPLVSTITP